MEKSVGCIIRNNEDKVLLVYEKLPKYWGFPKGHVEKDETEVETARREVLEEVGIEVLINENKRYVTNYTVKENVLKEVVFYEAKPLSENIIKQDSEIQDYKWVTYEDALKMLKYHDLYNILEKVYN